MKSKPLSIILVLTVLAFSLGNRGCSTSEIDRTLNALNALPPLVTSFHLPANIESRILEGIREGKAAFLIFRDNPTVGNLRNAIAVFQGLVDRGIFQTENPQIDQRLGPAIALVIFIMNTINPTAQAESRDADNQKVRISDEQQKVIDRKLDELGKLIKEGP